jgi:serine/threonine protein kinase
MMYCLNPNKPHENQGLTSTSSSDPAMTLSKTTASKPPGSIEERVTCHYCKYLLQEALLGDCRVTRWVGSGAFGDVYEAEQLPPLNRRVAIKVMSLDRVADGRSAELFTREAEAIAALDHPNILPVLRVGILEDGRSYLVMKYAANGSLQNYCQLTPQGLSILPTAAPGASEKDRISTQETLITDESLAEEEGEQSDDAQVTLAPISQEPTVLTPQQLLPYVEGAAAALQYAHDHGVIHLDVKPANLLLDGENRILLADFGVSTLLDGYTHASLHAYVGTPVYTAPEQWLEQPRAASDQYALAVTCYQLLTGRPPFTGNLYAIMHGHLQVAPPSLREFNPLVPAQVESVILRALAKEPAERYSDMLAFARAYQEALEEVAGAQADDQGDVQASQVAGQAANKVSMVQTITAPGVPAIREEAHKALKQKPGQEVMLAHKLTPAKAEWKPVGAKLHPSAKRKRGRLIGLVLLLLLLSGSVVGLIRFSDSCLLGICPGMKLGTNEVDFVNNASQQVKISNPGSANLKWSVSILGGATWLALSSRGGTLPAGKTADFTISTNVNKLPDGVYTALVRVSGQGLNPQDIMVKLTVQPGLRQIGVKVSGQSFSYSHGYLQPQSQMITITDKSNQTFNWSIQYAEKNSWLVVTPDQGSLQGGASVVLSVTANVQNLSSFTYQASISLIGASGTQAEPSLLSTFDFLLKVEQPGQTATPLVTPTPTPQTFNFPAFSAQAATPNGAPSTMRSDYSMVWDSQDDLVFVFGGIDGQGNLLNDAWSYNPITNAWKELNASNSSVGDCNGAHLPAPRMNAAMVWDSVDQQILLYGGLGANNQYFGDLWSYSPSAGTWTAIACSNNGPGTRSTSAVWTGNQMLLLGGANTYGLLSDFWSYTPGNNGGAWQKLPDSPMAQREFQTLVWDSADSQLYVFGGLDVHGVQQSDFYVYTPHSGWKAIAPRSSNNPPARQQAMGTWDSKDNLLLLMGGWKDGNGVPYWGLWAFDPKQDAWGLLTPLENGSSGPHIIPGRTGAMMVWDATDQEAFIYAGAGNGKSGSSLNDLWEVT